MQAARFTAVVVLPTPPFWFATANVVTLDTLARDGDRTGAGKPSNRALRRTGSLTAVPTLTDLPPTAGGGRPRYAADSAAASARPCGTRAGGAPRCQHMARFGPPRRVPGRVAAPRRRRQLPLTRRSRPSPPPAPRRSPVAAPRIRTRRPAVPGPVPRPDRGRRARRPTLRRVRAPRGRWGSRRRCRAVRETRSCERRSRRGRRLRLEAPPRARRPVSRRRNQGRPP